MPNQKTSWWWRGPKPGDRWRALAPLAVTLAVPQMGGDVVVPFGAVFVLAPFAITSIPPAGWPELTLIFLFYLVALGVIWGVWLLFFRAGLGLRVLIAPVGVLLCFGPLYWWRIFATIYALLQA